jgi:TRAP transporter TAXI family solute receptor
MAVCARQGAGWIGAVAAALALTAAAGAARSDETRPPETIRILTAEPGGAEHTLAAAFAGAIAKREKDVRVRLRTAPTSHERLASLNAGDAELAVVAGHALAAAHLGKAEFGFKHKLANLSVIARLHSDLVYVVAAKDAGIAQPGELKGKRVSVGLARSDAELAARAIFTAAGVKHEELRASEYLPFSDSAALLKNKELDVLVHLGPHGDVALVALARDVGIVLVELPAQFAAKLGLSIARATVAARINGGKTREVGAASIPYFLVTRTDLPAARVHRLTQLLFDHLDEVAAAHPAGKAITLAQASRGAPAPLHFGAAKYYREKQSR